MVKITHLWQIIRGFFTKRKLFRLSTFLSFTQNLVKKRSKSCKRYFWMPHYLEGLGKYVVDGGLKMYRTLSPARHISCKKLKQNFSWIFWWKKYEKSITFFCQRTVLRNGFEAFEAISNGVLFEKEIFIWSKFQGS